MPSPDSRQRSVPLPASDSASHPSAARQDTVVPPPSLSNQGAFEFPSVKHWLVSVPWLKKAVPFVVIVLALVISSVGLFQEYASIQASNASATATAETEATTTTDMNATATAETEATVTAYTNATATAQALATATTTQQIYAQVTSGTPAIDDPLNNNTNNWGTFNASWGACEFTGVAYHFTLSNGGSHGSIIFQAV